MSCKTNGCNGVVNMNKQYYRENLPMYINGSLPEDERADFEQQLSQDAELKKEADFLSSVRRYVKDEKITTPGEMGLFKLKRQIKNESENNVATKTLTKKWRTFAIAASLMLVVQAGVMVSMTQQQDAFVPLSGSDYSENVVQVQFKSSTRENDIRALLISLDASIIQGPSKNGIYRIELMNLNEETLKQLQQAKIVDFVTEE